MQSAQDLGVYLKCPTLCELGEPHFIRARGFERIITGTVDSALDRAYEGYVTASYRQILVTAGPVPVANLIRLAISCESGEASAR
jgi:hypothetical protein